MTIEVIGHLAKRFPDNIEPSYPQLVDWMEDALEKQFNTNAPEMLVVKGLLFTLGRLLGFEPDRYQKHPDKRQKVYSYVATTLKWETLQPHERNLPCVFLFICRYLNTVLATTVGGQLSRYQVAKSVLLFLSENCEKFRDEIGSNGYLWFSYTKFCCTSENKTVSSFIESCLRAQARVELMCYVLCLLGCRRSKSTRLRALTAF